MLRYILFHHQTTTFARCGSLSPKLRYILFHHQTTTICATWYYGDCCVISSFITKPQLPRFDNFVSHCCVISSFITKPQLAFPVPLLLKVALYPLSSPNHNWSLTFFLPLLLRYILFHHQTTTHTRWWYTHELLRYILFHHQTTTVMNVRWLLRCCVISSFITKPQLSDCRVKSALVALYPLSSPNHNTLIPATKSASVALYPLSSPNHNPGQANFSPLSVALYPLSSPNHN